MESKKNQKTLTVTKKKHPYRYGEQTSGHQWGVRRGRGTTGEGD